jgi:hypothetical protein
MGSIMTKTVIVEIAVDGSSGDIDTEHYLARLFVERLWPLFKSKHKSYGPHNISMFGIQGVIIRLWDKMQRLARFAKSAWSESPVTDETIEDTLCDVAIYAMIGLLLRDNKWPKQP